VVALRAGEKGLEVNVLISDDVPAQVIGDITRVRQIAINLLTNGVKFTEKGEVVVTVEQQPAVEGAVSAGMLKFTVRDTGIGIPADRLDRLFQSFSQADASTSRRYGGTGLGLAISKRLVELMGGDIWIESEAGVGTTVHFTLVLPIAAGDTAGPGIDDRWRNQRVLVVEQHPTTLTKISQLLRSWGVIAQTTSSGETAMDWLRQGHQFDTAVVDSLAVTGDGSPAVASIRAMRDAPTLPIIVYHAPGPRNVGFAPVAGLAHISKPVTASSLFNALIETSGGLAGAGETVAASPVIPELDRDEQPPIRVLLAEDNLVNQKLALRMLEKLGFAADVAANGVEAIAAIDKQTYDLVLMDIQMPEMDGWQATREIRSRWPENEGPRIVALTANAMAEDRQRCFDEGMDDYLTKPIQAEELQRVLAEATTISAGAPS